MRKIGFTMAFMLITLTVGLTAQTGNFHAFTVENIDGESFSLSELRGKKVLVVNVASKCGLTPQYEQLQSLYERYGGDKFTIVAFPANNFASQEPGTNSEIKEFCTVNYGVTFPVMAKISVKGDDTAPVYQWLTKKSQNGKQDAEVTWNFQKFLIDENGNWVATIPPKTLPDDDRIINWITIGELLK
ncbi:MAG: glutathione peroxidase [Tannerella sp.]|jgi:glutathione peroxidase|nr:glutathione peroxidase [Tannerella sp.]